MPKVSRTEWEGYLDSLSQENAPTRTEIQNDEYLVEQIRWALNEFLRNFGFKKCDRYFDSGEEDKLNATDPDDMWTELAYLREDYLKKVKDKRVKKEWEEKIVDMEKRVYKQYIPFIDANIQRFGLANSPYEKSQIYSTNAYEIRWTISFASEILTHFHISEDDSLDFQGELDRLALKLESYENEPGLFTFERVEQELQKEIYEIEYGGFGRRSGATVSLDVSEKFQGNSLETIKQKVNFLQEIARAMVDVTIKGPCESRANALLGWVEYLHIKSEAPRELLRIQGELKEVFRKFKENESINTDEVQKMKEVLEELKTKTLDFEIREFIKKLLGQIQKIGQSFVSGVFDEEEDILFDETGKDWAYSLLGISRDATEDELKTAYRTLAKKFHPDRNKASGSEEKMKRINEAYNFVKRMMGER